MKRAVVGFALAATTALWAAPAGAAVPASPIRTDGWVPAPSEPFDRAAGVLCDFPVHGEPVVDEVRKRTLQSYPDGTPKSELWVGRLVIRVTNTDTGASVDSDASGDAVITYGTDGSQFWYVVGPTQVGFRAGSGNLPRGLYRLTGVYTLALAADGHKTVTNVAHLAAHDICTDID